MVGSKPDETILCRFRNRLIKDGLDKQILSLINHQFGEVGLIVKNVPLSMLL